MASELGSAGVAGMTYCEYLVAQIFPAVVAKFASIMPNEVIVRQSIAMADSVIEALEKTKRESVAFAGVDADRSSDRQ